MTNEQRNLLIVMLRSPWRPFTIWHQFILSSVTSFGTIPSLFLKHSLFTGMNTNFTNLRCFSCCSSTSPFSISSPLILKVLPQSPFSHKPSLVPSLLETPTFSWEFIACSSFLPSPLFSSSFPLIFLTVTLFSFPSIAS